LRAGAWRQGLVVSGMVAWTTQRRPWGGWGPLACRPPHLRSISRAAIRRRIPGKHCGARAVNDRAARERAMGPEVWILDRQKGGGL